MSSKELSKKTPRLYAMGVDAYRLGSRLDRLSDKRQTYVRGKTGILRLDSKRRIQSKLTLARMDATGPVRLTPSVQQKSKSGVFG